MTKTCAHCSSKFKTTHPKAAYCGRECFGDKLRGVPRPENRGENHPNWKSNVGYRQIHVWIRQTQPRPQKCTKCGKNASFTAHGRWTIEWANISGKYLRDVSDWIALCRKCHFIMDRGTNGRGNPDPNKQWSLKHPCCKNCNTTKKYHVAHGLCFYCYERSKKKHN